MLFLIFYTDILGMSLRTLGHYPFVSDHSLMSWHNWLSLALALFFPIAYMYELLLMLSVNSSIKTNIKRIYKYSSR